MNSVEIVTDKVKDFIKRRFPDDCNWTSGNCYYFAVILASAFNGKIYYDVVMGHFVTKIGYNYYDYNGLYPYYADRLVEWDKFDDYDSLQLTRIVRDCIN